MKPPHPTTPDAHGSPDIQAIRDILGPLESHILAHWEAFKEAYDLPADLDLMDDARVTFSSGHVLVYWTEWDGKPHRFRLIPWPAFLAFYRQHS